MEKQLRYMPPYDSPIEDAFAWSFFKYIGEEVEVYPQYEVQTDNGDFKLDFAIKIENTVIGIECDGKDYHNIGRDLWRDVMIIENSQISDIFRFRGSDITYFINECFVILNWYYPELYSKRGLKNILQLADYEVINEDFYSKDFFKLIDIAYKGYDEQIKIIKVWRTSIKSYDYKKKAKIIKRNPGKSAENLYEKHKQDIF